MLYVLVKACANAARQNKIYGKAMEKIIKYCRYSVCDRISTEYDGTVST